MQEVCLVLFTQFRFSKGCRRQNSPLRVGFSTEGGYGRDFFESEPVLYQAPADWKRGEMLAETAVVDISLGRWVDVLVCVE